MPGATDLEQAEQVILEASLPSIGYAPVLHSITRDPDLPDGPYRTLVHYYEYTQQKNVAWPSVITVAQARGLTPRTIVRHRRQLVALGYIEIIYDDDRLRARGIEMPAKVATTATVLLKDPDKIPRLLNLTQGILNQRRAKKGHPAPTESGQSLLTSLRQLRPDFHLAGARKLRQAYQGEIPLERLLAHWLENKSYIPRHWKTGLIYRQLEQGQTPPGPHADPDLSAAIKASMAQATAKPAQTVNLADPVALWAVALDRLRLILPGRSFGQAFSGTRGLRFLPDGSLLVQLGPSPTLLVDKGLQVAACSVLEQLTGRPVAVKFVR